MLVRPLDQILTKFWFAGGFTIASALSFASAFLLVSIGICIFSLTGNKYDPLIEEQDLQEQVGGSVCIGLEDQVKSGEHTLPLDHDNSSNGTYEDQPMNEPLNDGDMRRPKAVVVELERG